MAFKGEAWGRGVDIDHTRRGVASTKRTLRPAQDFDAFERSEFRQGVTRARAVDTVDEHRDRTFEAGVVANRTDAANTRGTVRFVTGGGDEQRRGNLVQFADVGGSGIRECFRGNSRNGDRHIGQFLCTTLSGHDDDRRRILYIRIVDQIAFISGGLGKCCLRCECKSCPQQCQRAQRNSCLPHGKPLSYWYLSKYVMPNRYASCNF